jgi:hypothetical protein
MMKERGLKVAASPPDVRRWLCLAATLVLRLGSTLGSGFAQAARDIFAHLLNRVGSHYQPRKAIRSLPEEHWTIVNRVAGGTARTTGQAQSTDQRYGEAEPSPHIRRQSRDYLPFSPVSAELIIP